MLTISAVCPPFPPVGHEGIAGQPERKVRTSRTSRTAMSVLRRQARPVRCSGWHQVRACTAGWLHVPEPMTTSVEHCLLLLPSIAIERLLGSTMMIRSRPSRPRKPSRPRPGDVQTHAHTHAHTHEHTHTRTHVSVELQQTWVQYTDRCEHACTCTCTPHTPIKAAPSTCMVASVTSAMYPDSKAHASAGGVHRFIDENDN